MIDRTNEFVSLLAALFLSPALNPSSSCVSCDMTTSQQLLGPIKEGEPGYLQQWLVG